jgi:hypothetical protein
MDSDSWTMCRRVTHFSIYFSFAIGKSRRAILFTIQMESNNLEGDDRTVTFSTSENVIHPYYNSLTLEHDIALIKLRMPVQYSSRNHPNKIRVQQNSLKNLL